MDADEMLWHLKHPFTEPPKQPEPTETPELEQPEETAETPETEIPENTDVPAADDADFTEAAPEASAAATETEDTVTEPQAEEPAAPEQIRQNSRLQKMLQVNCRRRTSSTYYPARRPIRRNMMHSPISL